MALTLKEKKELVFLKKLGGRKVPVKLVSAKLGRISIGGKGFTKMNKMIIQNTTVSARSIIMARKKLIRMGLN